MNVIKMVGFFSIVATAYILGGYMLSNAKIDINITAKPHAVDTTTNITPPDYCVQRPFNDSTPAHCYELAGLCPEPYNKDTPFACLLLENDPLSHKYKGNKHE